MREAAEEDLVEGKAGFGHLRLHQSPQRLAAVGQAAGDLAQLDAQRRLAAVERHEPRHHVQVEPGGGVWGARAGLGRHYSELLALELRLDRNSTILKEFSKRGLMDLNLKDWVVYFANFTGTFV